MFKAEIGSAVFVFAVALGWQLWVDLQKGSLYWGMIPLAAVTVAAAVFSARIFWKIVRS